jgi:hypothetical protein
MRVGKQLYAARILIENRQSDSLNQSQLTLSHGVDKGGVDADDDDDG